MTTVKKGQLHCHSSRVWEAGGPPSVNTKDLMLAFRNEGYQFVALTQHDASYSEIFEDPDVNAAAPTVTHVPSEEDGDDDPEHMLCIGLDGCVAGSREPCGPLHDWTPQRRVNFTVSYRNAFAALAHPISKWGWSQSNLDNLKGYHAIEINSTDNFQAWLRTLSYRLYLHPGEVLPWGIRTDDWHGNQNELSLGWVLAQVESTGISAIKDSLRRGAILALRRDNRTISDKVAPPSLDVSVSASKATIKLKGAGWSPREAFRIKAATVKNDGLLDPIVVSLGSGSGGIPGTWTIVPEDGIVVVEAITPAGLRCCFQPFDPFAIPRLLGRPLIRSLGVDQSQGGLYHVYEAMINWCIPRPRAIPPWRYQNLVTEISAQAKIVSGETSPDKTAGRVAIQIPVRGNTPEYVNLVFKINAPWISLKLDPIRIDMPKTSCDIQVVRTKCEAVDSIPSTLANVGQGNLPGQMLYYVIECIGDPQNFGAPCIFEWGNISGQAICGPVQQVANCMTTVYALVDPFHGGNAVLSVSCHDFHGIQSVSGIRKTITFPPIDLDLRDRLPEYDVLLKKGPLPLSYVKKVRDIVMEGANRINGRSSQ